MLDDLNAVAITTFHDERLLEVEWPGTAERHFTHGPWHWIELNHLCNSLLWHEEDQARRTDVPAEEIARCKRMIDQHNQRRNDAVERIDECILAALRHVVPQPGARLSSETAGAMVDRLSILGLKIHHMRLQTRRRDASPDHIESCTGKLRRLIEQRSDLRLCLDSLLAETRAGEAYFKVYRQFKMYNDPTLNPYLYAIGPAGSAATAGR